MTVQRKAPRQPSVSRPNGAGRERQGDEQRRDGVEEPRQVVGPAVGEGALGVEEGGGVARQVVVGGPRLLDDQLDLAALDGDDEAVRPEVARPAADRREGRRLARFSQVEALGGQLTIHETAQHAIGVAHHDHGKDEGAPGTARRRGRRLRHGLQNRRGRRRLILDDFRQGRRPRRGLRTAGGDGLRPDGPTGRRGGAGGGLGGRVGLGDELVQA